MAETSKTTNSANLGLETRRWTATDAQRRDMDAFEMHAGALNFAFGSVQRG